MAELFEDAADLGDLLGVGGGELAASDEERILEADAHVAAHHRRLRRERNLRAARRQHRPAIVVAEQAIRGFLHEHEIAHVGADAAEDAEDGLDEERRLDEPAVDEMREIVEMPDVVAFVLEARAVLLAEHLQDALDVAERVAEDEIVGAPQIGLLPVVLPGLVAIGEAGRWRSSSSPC